MINRILKLMQEQNISKGQLIKTTGLPRSTIYSIFENDRSCKKSRIETVQLIASALNTSVDYLITGNETLNKNINTQKTMQYKISRFMQVNNIKSVADFARLADLPYTTVDNIFKKSNNITSATLVKLKNIMQVSADELLDDSIDIDFEAIKNKKYIDGKIDIPENTVILIGRGGKRSIYTISDDDAAIVDNLLERLGKKHE